MKEYPYGSYGPAVPSGPPNMQDSDKHGTISIKLFILWKKMYMKSISFYISKK